MSWIPPSRSPESCRTPRCGNLQEFLQQGEHRDRCLDDRPMHEECPWHTKNKPLGKAIEARAPIKPEINNEP